MENAVEVVSGIAAAAADDAGVTVAIEETIQSFEALVSGELDEVPEQAFFNVGGAE